MPLAISTDDLTCRYRAGGGVESLSLRLPRGEIYGFLGPNGAGKSTTIRLLLGLLRPQRGRVELLGETLDRNRDVLRRVGALVDSPSLYPQLSGFDNLDVSRRLLGLPKARVAASLERVGLAAAARQRVAEYSLGMRQRLGVALALIGSPELLILDEPTNGLDPAGRADFRRLIQSVVAEDGVTVLVSSHLLAEVEQVASHVGILDRGRLRFQGPIDELKARNRPRLRLKCDAADAAAAICAARGWRAGVDAESWLEVDAASSDLAPLLGQLAAEQVEVRDVEIVKPSLETLFLGVLDDASVATAGDVACAA